MPSELCHCGEPLHYTDPEVERQVRALVDELGEFLDVTTTWGTWKVPRHYIALHGIEAFRLPDYGFEQVAITCQQCKRTSHNKNDIEQKYCGNCHQFF